MTIAYTLEQNVPSDEVRVGDVLIEDGHAREITFVNGPTAPAVVIEWTYRDIVLDITGVRFAGVTSTQEMVARKVEV